MNNNDRLFMHTLLQRSNWLFYGDLEETIDDFARKVFERPLVEYGLYGAPIEALPYWLFLSELVALDLAEYGGSPRGAWLTPEGERFKAICLAYPNAIADSAQLEDGE